MFQREKVWISPEEYLAMEEQADHKSEYFNGEIFAMVGASINHNRITGNINAFFNTALARSTCESFASDMRLQVKANGLYTYPDVMVVCGKPEFATGRNDTITNPILIVEVLSPSTKNYDRGQKFMLYRAIETLLDYVLVDQDRPHVEYFHRLDDGRWILTEFDTMDASLQLEALQLEIPLSRIYQKVDWQTE